MKFSALLLPLSLMFMAAYTHSASIALTEDDCLEILERYAADPESVPQHLLDACKEMLGAIAPAAGQQKPTADPCVDPSAGDSVQCWGPWAALAPAAAGFKPTVLADIDDFETRPELAAALSPDLLPNELPLGECAAGTACGFATIAPGLIAQPANTNASDIVPFALNGKGENFQLNPSPAVVDLPSLSSLSGLQSPGFPGPARFQAADGETASLIIANVNRNADDDLIDAAGLWRHGSMLEQSNDNTRAGVFAWGIASSATFLERLNAGNVTATFTGNMAGDNRTVGSIIVNFGSQPNWSGNWQNSARGFAVDASGGIRGANLLSTSVTGANVVADGSYVQGILQGEEGNQSVAHAINVVLTDGDVIKDVGSLRRTQ